jgi:CRP-like cAMP-binding protein
MKSLCGSIDVMENHITMISDKQSEQRCAQTLIMLINKYGLKQKKILKIKLSLDELASFMCMSRSYMKKIMIDFSGSGLINYSAGEITILDKKQLERVALKIN